MFDGKKNVLLIFKHLGLLDSGDCILSDKLESTVLIVKLAFPKENLREASAAKKLDDLEVTELKAIVADGLFEESRNNGDFTHRSVHKVLNSARSFFVDELSERVAKRLSLKADGAVVGSLTFFYVFLNMLLEVAMNRS